MRVAELVNILKALPPEMQVSSLEKTIINNQGTEYILVEDMHNSACLTKQDIENLGLLYVTKICRYKREDREPVTIDDIKNYIRFLQDVLAEIETLKVIE